MPGPSFGRRLLGRLRRLAGRSAAAPVANDAHVSRLSVSRFAARWAEDAAVIEIGCLDGEGLAAIGAASRPRSLRGFDEDSRRIAAGKRRRSLDLRHVDLSALAEAEPAADLIVAIYRLQCLAAPDLALDWCARHRRPGGRVLVAVPPVVDEGTMAQHRAIPGHRTHRFVWEWELRLRDRFPQVELFRHLAPAGAALDFSSPAPSAWRPEDFRFVPITPAEIDEGGSLGLVMVAGYDGGRTR
jgi:SAM-dependent methyltransferase